MISVQLSVFVGTVELDPCFFECDHTCLDVRVYQIKEGFKLLLCIHNLNHDWHILRETLNLESVDRASEV